MTNPRTQSHYDRIGGSAVVETIVDAFYKRVLADPELAPFFAETEMARLRRHQIAFMEMVLGGPKNYDGPSMHLAHAGRGIEARHFHAVALHLAATLQGAGVTDPDAATIIGIVAGLRDEILDP